MSCFFTVALYCCLAGVSGPAPDQPQLDGQDKKQQAMPLLFAADFQAEDSGELPGGFEFTDKSAWQVERLDGDEHVLSQFKKSDYAPPHRSPLNIGLVNDVTAGDFVLTARVRSTIPDYGHRDACVFFGYQDEAHFYYVHLGKQTDDHANQVFIVDDAPRTKISSKTTKGTPWDDHWHTVKITRDAASGEIAVYFDDMDDPVMTAKNKKFAYGRVGFGSFDDTTQWDDIRLHGVRHAERSNQKEKPPKVGRL